MAIATPAGRSFYETEALRGGWTVRQLDRQIGTQSYERTMLSRNKAAMLTKGQKARPEDAVTPEEEIKDPFVLEFLDLKDEYSESELEQALIVKLPGIWHGFFEAIWRHAIASLGRTDRNRSARASIAHP